MDKLLPLVFEYWQSPWIRVALILLSTFVVAFMVQKVAIRMVSKLTQKTDTDFDDRVVEALKPAIFVSVLLFGASYATEELQPGPHSLFVIQGMLKSIAVVVWGMAVMRIGSEVLRWLSRVSERMPVIQSSTLPLFEIAFKLVTFGAIVYGAFIAWGIDVTAWLASAGIVGIAVGFAAKDTLANLFAGIFILTDAPYKIGDFIVLNGEERGMVTQIGIRSTRILTRDDIEITVPNAMIANSQIINETGGRHPKRRVRIDVGIAYGSDVEQVRNILFACAAAADHVCDEPEPRCHFVRFGESSLDFQLKIWIEEPVLKGKVIDQVNTLIYNALNEAGIEIPFPKRDVYIKEVPDRLAKIRQPDRKGASPV